MLQGIAITGSDFQVYCRDCEHTYNCDKKNKPFILDSVADAIEMKRLRKDVNFNIDEISYKSYQMSIDVDRLVAPKEG